MKLTETDRDVRVTPAHAIRHDERQRRFVEIRRRDAAGPPPLAAVAYAGPSGFRTYAPPQRFIGSDGESYLVKHRAQQGLGAELIAGRLGAFLGVAPQTVPIALSAAALPADGSMRYLTGLRLGLRELDQVFNDAQLKAFGMVPEKEQVDWASWALAVSFQSWVYVRDAQAVIRWSDGKVFSVDHGDCFFDLAKGPATGLVVPGLQGVSGVSFDSALFDAAVGQIEAIPESAILQAVSDVPQGDEWRMPIDRRVRVAEWLLVRQLSIREVIPWKRVM